MPVDGDSSAAAQVSAGSRLSASPRVKLEIANPAAQRIGLDRPQSVQLVGFGGNDQFAGAPMGDAVLAAIGIETLAALDAERAFRLPGG